MRSGSRSTTCSPASHSLLGHYAGFRRERDTCARWLGGFGSAWYNDPDEDMTTVMFQRRLDSASPPIFVDFWTAAYQAIDD